MLVYLGTQRFHERSASRGIYAAEFNAASGAVSDPWLEAEASNPTFLVLSPDGTCLYSTGGSALRALPDLPPGFLAAYAVDSVNGRLRFLNQEPTGPATASHVAVDFTGRFAFAAHFVGGSVCAVPILADGRLGPRRAYFPSSEPARPDPLEQGQSSPHSVTISPGNRFALACNYGLDRILLFRLDLAGAGLEAHSPAFAALPRGSGPRHAKFSADGRHFYVANQKGSSVSVFTWSESSASLELQQTLSTLPTGSRGENAVAEIRVHPNERFVYVSNRGHDSIALFERDAGNGLLRPLEITPSGGAHPRNFCLSPDGEWLLCANRDSNNLVSFRVDAGSGRLTQTRTREGVPEPVCVLFRGPLAASQAGTS